MDQKYLMNKCIINLDKGLPPPHNNDNVPKKFLFLGGHPLGTIFTNHKMFMAYLVTFYSISDATTVTKKRGGKEIIAQESNTRKIVTKFSIYALPLNDKMLQL